jgi:hypothetical protein
MKRASIFGVVAALVAGFLFAAPAAHAQALQTAVNGGVTCKQYSTGYVSYPLTFWDCINTGSNPTSFESVVGQSARTLPAGMKTTLTNTELMIFTNRTNFAAFTGTAAPPAKMMSLLAAQPLYGMLRSRLFSLDRHPGLFSVLSTAIHLPICMRFSSLRN